MNKVPLSRSHAQISRQGDNLVLEDLGSTNGTFVNEVRVERVVLRSGDRIRVGKTEMVLVKAEV